MPLEGGVTDLFPVCLVPEKLLGQLALFQLFPFGGESCDVDGGFQTLPLTPDGANRAPCRNELDAVGGQIAVVFFNALLENVNTSF